MEFLNNTEDELEGRSKKIQTVLSCCLLDISNLQITDKLLKVKPLIILIKLWNQIRIIEVLNMKGYALSLMEKHKEADECCDKALAIKPDSDMTLGNKGKD